MTAETLYEAAVLGLKALNAPLEIMHNMSVDIKVKSPETNHRIGGAVLSAWLSRPGKSPKEQALKTRLRDLMRG